MQYFRTIHEIITTGHWITDQVSRELKEYKITEPQYNVLRTLKEANGKPLTVQFIQSKMVQRSSNVTRIIDKLILKNCVNREENRLNRRKMDVTLTEQGEKFLDKLDEKVIAMHAPLMENLTDEELKTLEILIKKLKEI